MEKKKELAYSKLEMETRDSETASICVSQNQRFTAEKRAGIVWFKFEDKEACESIIDAHRNKELIVCYKDLTNAIHEIKKIIIQFKNNK